jgi:hypothetical protein
MLRLVEEEMLYAKCSIEGCNADTNQRYDKFGAIIEHKKTKKLFCVPHAMEGIRDKSIADWDFLQFGIDEEAEDEPEGYDCLHGNPKCERCGMLLSMSDMDSWLEHPERPPYCEQHFEEEGQEESDEEATPPDWKH